MVHLFTESIESPLRHLESIYHSLCGKGININNSIQEINQKPIHSQYRALNKHVIPVLLLAYS